MTKQLFVIGLIIFISLSVVAGTGSPGSSSLEFYPAGKINQCPVYQLSLNNPTSTSYQVIIRDVFGAILYEEYIRGKDIIRNYMIDVHELGNTPVTIEVMNASGTQIKKFTTHTQFQGR